MEKPLKPYDKKAKCPKCGHPEVKTSYFGTRDYHSYMDRCEARSFSEHLHRLCALCSFKWPEACLPEKKR